MKHEKLAKAMGANLVAEVPDTGGGAFGAARLAGIVASLQKQLKPGLGRRPGRPTNRRWRHRAKIPMSTTTRRKLASLADRLSSRQRKVSPMQVAAEILERALTDVLTK